jgi:hypothetical protein
LNHIAAIARSDATANPNGAAIRSLMDDSASESNPPKKKRPMERNANAAIKRP